jgi:GlpG protein
MVESIAGSGRYLALVLAIGVLSNLGQYFYPIDSEWFLHPFTYTPRINPMFGGMSGVVYGLFGFVWMKMKFHRHAGYYLDQTSITIFLVWFAACTLGFLENVAKVANTAHLAGLLLGMAIGFASAKWATRR